MPCQPVCQCACANLFELLNPNVGNEVLQLRQKLHEKEQQLYLVSEQNAKLQAEKKSRVTERMTSATPSGMGTPGAGSAMQGLEVQDAEAHLVVV